MTRRRRSVAFGLALVWALPAAFFAAFALDLQGEGIPAGQRAGYAGLAAVFGLLCVRTARIGVRTRECDVLVRGVLRTRRVPWDEVARFEWGLWRGWGTFPVGVLRRTDASQITILALNPPFAPTPGRDPGVDGLLDDLNAELARHRATAGAVPAVAPPAARAGAPTLLD